MNWQSILNEAVYPALALLIVTMAGVLLKTLANWLNAKAAQTKDERLKAAIVIFAGAAEQMAANAEKASKEKWSGEKKKEQVKTDALQFVQDNKLPVTDTQIDKLIEGVLGEAKLSK